MSTIEHISNLKRRLTEGSDVQVHVRQHLRAKSGAGDPAKANIWPDKAMAAFAAAPPSYKKEHCQMVVELAKSYMAEADEEQAKLDQAKRDYFLPRRRKAVVPATAECSDAAEGSRGPSTAVEPRTSPRKSQVIKVEFSTSSTSTTIRPPRTHE